MTHRFNTEKSSTFLPRHQSDTSALAASEAGDSMLTKDPPDQPHATDPRNLNQRLG